MRDASDRDPPSGASDPSSTTREGSEKQFEYEIALGSSGWLFVYYVGVVKAMRELGMARCVGVRALSRRRARAVRSWLDARCVRLEERRRDDTLD